MEQYINFVFKNNQKMPLCRDDIERFADLHSWYKKLSGGYIVYPLLLCGEEARYDFDPKFTDENQNNFHWTMVFESDIDIYDIKTEQDDYSKIPEQLKILMKKYPVALDCSFSSSNELKINQCISKCEQFWEELSQFNEK